MRKVQTFYYIYEYLWRDISYEMHLGISSIAIRVDFHRFLNYLINTYKN